MYRIIPFIKLIRKDVVYVTPQTVRDILKAPLIQQANEKMDTFKRGA